MRKIAAIVVAGIVYFCWGYVSHMALGLGDAGLQSVPEAADAVIDQLPAAGMTEPGLYYFPSLPKEKQSDEQSMKVWTERVMAKPSGMVIYAPKDRVPMPPSNFVIEILTCLVLSAIALGLMTCAAGWLRSLGSRVAFAATLGAFAGIARDVRHWNWYEYPTTFTVAQLVDSVIGMALVGIVLAIIAKPVLDAAAGERAA